MLCVGVGEWKKNFQKVLLTRFSCSFILFLRVLVAAFKNTESFFSSAFSVMTGNWPVGCEVRLQNSAVNICE